jgi:S-adenosylmethionine:tRNA ribosyltransferase-isomerase
LASKYILSRERVGGKLLIKTRIFIYPGFQRRIVDSLITNFHLPQSTLLMLAASFIGYEIMKEIYAYAIAGQYRFYSFGDGMFLRK